MTAALASASMGAMAQSVPTHEMYVDFGITASEGLVQALDKWQPGDNFSKDPNYVDENFFISRVPLKKRFVNPETQANKNLVDGQDKNLCWCVPIGEMTKKWGPLQRYNFNGDNFNMWQYINIHANWSNSWFRVPGSFNDVAHKNGVRTGCLYFIDWASSVTESSETGKTLGELCAKENGKFKYAKKLIQFLKYYGIDGIGLNPEGQWSSTLNDNFSSFLAECHKEAEKQNHPFHVEWYAFVSNQGGLSDNGCTLGVGQNDKWFHKDGAPVTDVFFLNYNWSRTGLEKSVNAAKSLGRSSYDVYAGYDQQGRGYGDLGNGGWKALMDNPVSIVVWGAHDRSQLYASSTEAGNSDLSTQYEYQTKQELLFTGGNRNVLDLPALKTGSSVTASYSDLADWHGYSTAVIEESSLTETPFVSRFNLGNGMVFRKDGEVTFDHKWYNLGMQDLLPSWRWWIDNGDGKTVPADAVKCDFTFEDSWFAGSCLNIHGATANSNVRLFNTKFNVESGDDAFNLVFKVNSGNDPMLKLMVSKIGSENDFQMVKVPAEGVAQGKWAKASLKASDFGLKAGDVIACIGLNVAGTADDYSLLLGEMAFVPASFSKQPVAPVIQHASVLKRVYNRADFKVTFDVPFEGTRDAAYQGCPIYNEEVNAWYYEIYVKQGDAERLVATTTSWAAYVVDAPLNTTDDTFQIGVRTIGLDGQAQSEIVWSKALESELSIIDNLTIDKNIIKPGEEFTIGFEDPNHAASDIEIQDALTGEVKASVSGKLSLTASLDATGTYDVKVTSNGEVKMNRAMILITPEETGRLPQIGNIAANPKTVEAKKNVRIEAEIEKGDNFDGDVCTVSKSLYMKEPYQLAVDSKVMNEFTNTSFALWFKVEKFEHASLGTLLMTKVNRNYQGTWTEQVWGEMWTAIRPAGYAKNNNLKRDNAENELSVCFDGPRAGTWNYEHNNDVDGLTDGYTLSPNTWYHVCVVKSGYNAKMYLNGKLVIDVQTRGAGPKDWKGANFYVGGSMTNLASFTGWVDEVQIWSKALSQDEVREAMNGYVIAPEGLEGYFTFEESEQDEDGNFFFPNMGAAATAVPGAYMTTSVQENGKTVDVPQNQFTTDLGVPALIGNQEIRYESSKWMIEGATFAADGDNAVNAKFNQEGTYSVTLTATNSWGSVVKTVDDVVVVTPASGIDNEKTEANYYIYPNPFKEQAHLMFAEAGNYDVVVFDAAGKRVSAYNYDAAAGEVCELNFDAPQGMYYVTILQKGLCVRTIKIIKE